MIFGSTTQTDTVHVYFDNGLGSECGFGFLERHNFLCVFLHDTLAVEDSICIRINDFKYIQMPFYKTANSSYYVQ